MATGEGRSWRTAIVCDDDDNDAIEKEEEAPEAKAAVAEPTTVTVATMEHEDESAAASRAMTVWNNFTQVTAGGGATTVRVTMHTLMMGGGAAAAAGGGGAMAAAAQRPVVQPVQPLGAAGGEAATWAGRYYTTPQALSAAFQRARRPLRRMAAMSDLVEPLPHKPAKKVLVALLCGALPAEVPLCTIMAQVRRAVAPEAPPLVLLTQALLLQPQQKANHQRTTVAPSDIWPVNGVIGHAMAEALRELLEAELQERRVSLPATAPAPTPAPCVVCADDAVGLRHHCGDPTHALCTACLRNYIQVSRHDHVDDTRHVPCVAPGCAAPYSQASLVAALGHVGLLRATWRARSATMAAFGVLLTCGCGATVAVDELVAHKVRTVVCPGCPISYCLRCRNPHALNPTVNVCEQTEEFTLAKHQVVSCPRCAVAVSRDLGCNHMTCVCRHEFCYICLDDWRCSEAQRPDFNNMACNHPDPRFYGRSDRRSLY
jgi:hypothetical protein